MRIVILAPSIYSETTCALAARLAEMGHIPTGAIVLSTLNRETLSRKLGQWGVKKVARYARTKFIPQAGGSQIQPHNPYLSSFLKHEGAVFRNLREISEVYNFPISFYGNQNEPKSIARLRQWTPDVVIFTGGNILRKQLLEVPRLGVLNAHLGLLPEIRGMSSPEWSLLTNVPPGITIHWIDAGIDTGPILRRCALPDLAGCESLSDLRNRLIAYGVEKMVEVVSDIDRNSVSSTPQSDHGRDNQFFVMHEWLQERAAGRLSGNRTTAVEGMVHG